MPIRWLHHRHRGWLTAGHFPKPSPTGQLILIPRPALTHARHPAPALQPPIYLPHHFQYKINLRRSSMNSGGIYTLFSVSTIKECHNLTSCTGCLRAERGSAGARSNFLRNGPCHGWGVLLNLRHIGKIGVRSDRASRQFPKIGHSSRAGARIIPVKNCPGYKPFFTGP